MPARGRTRWGWHQLDNEWARRIVAGAGLRQSDLVLDIGAGAGSLTAALVDAGARVIAVELHPGRANELRQRFAGCPVVVVAADASDLRLPRRAFRVVANPPFAICAPLLRRLVAPGSRMWRADLVLPRPVARRWVLLTAPGAARWSTEFTSRWGGSLPRAAFRPPAPVDTSLLVLERRERTAVRRRTGTAPRDATR